MAQMKSREMGEQRWQNKESGGGKQEWASNKGICVHGNE
jgi:hypothetical protein